MVMWLLSLRCSPCGELLDRFEVYFDAEAGLVRYRQVALAVQLERLDEDVVYVGGGREELHPASLGEGGAGLEVCGHAHSRVPAVEHHQDAVVVGGPRDAPPLRYAA